LEGGSVARAQCGEAEHEEQGGGEERRVGHEAKESGDRDEEDPGQGGDSSNAIGEPAAEGIQGKLVLTVA